MDLGLTGKAALVTGASKGIGYGVAHALASEGADVILVSREIKLADIKQRMGPVRGSIEVVNADLSVSGTAEKLGERFPKVEILVNNAGAVPPGTLQQIDEKTWRAAWDLKVFGYINTCRVFYPLMAANGGGTIINIAGIGAVIKNPSAICIAAGNAAIAVMSQSLGSTSHKDNIRVVAVNPGPVATERLQAASGTQGNEKFNAAASLPWARPAAVDEVANTIIFLASPRSSYTSGSIVTVDGGISAAAQGL